MNQEVALKINGQDSGSVLVVPESSMAGCDACGDDLYVHEWIEQDTQDIIRDCDRLTHAN